jgi:hypothetical protein
LFNSLIVMEDLDSKTLWKESNKYVLGSVHIAVMRVKEHLVTQTAWLYIDVYIVLSADIAVMCVIKYSATEEI